MWFEVPPFHLRDAIYLRINMLGMVELRVELWWNYVKFHPNSTYNSTIYNHLIIKMITIPRWKGGTSNDKNYFSEKTQEKVLTAVKNREKRTLCLLLAYTKLPTTNNRQPFSHQKRKSPWDLRWVPRTFWL